jgi:inosine-uridine nucleoside N-ribohydrolase
VSKIPVILDTDIGSDIDDTWALAFLLRCPELDLKLVVTERGDTLYRAKIVAKLLERNGRSDVAVAVGLPQELRKQDSYPQTAWVEDYDLASYPGTVHEDGVDALIAAIMSSPEPVTLCAIGPVPNLKAALLREPRIAERARFVGMHGCFDWSHNRDGSPIAEWNVRAEPAACQAVFAAPWEKTITPLDTCARVRLTGEKYRAVAESNDPLAQDVIENYRVWKDDGHGKKWTDGSSILFDCVAVYLCYCQELLEMKQQPVRVDDEGFTRVEPGAPEVNCAMAWRDLGKFEDLLVARLTSGAGA